MFFGPIASLEMLTSSRRARYFIVRVVYAAVLFVMLWINYTELLQEQTYRQGASGPVTSISTLRLAQFSAAFFITFSFVQITAVLLLTPAMIAGAIAQERERRTIEYLFASSLSDGEIVMSKFLARTVHVASLLLAGMPILAIAMMLGGIDPERLLLVFAITLSALLTTAALSIAVGAWAKRSRDAVVRTYALLLALLIVPPVMWGLAFLAVNWPWLGWLSDAGALASQLNPIAVLLTIFASGKITGLVISPWREVWPLVVGSVVFSVVVLTWTIVSLRRVYRKSVGAGDAVEGHRFWQWWRSRFRPRLRRNPMLWKELFAATAAVNLGPLARIVVALLFAISLLPAILILYDSASRGFRTYSQLGEELAAAGAGIGTTLECAALLVVIIRAAGSITAEKERDSWLTLISTPLAPSEIVWAKIAGSIYAARWFLLPIGFWWVLTAIFSPHFFVIIPVLCAGFLCVALALSGIGLWFSSWCSTSIRAMAAAVAVAVFLGGGYLMCCVPLLFAASSSDGVELVLTPCIPFLLFAPPIFWMQFKENSNMSSDMNRMVTICFLGSIGYFVLGMLMAAANVSGFDDRAGRPRAGMQRLRLGEPPSSPPEAGDRDVASASATATDGESAGDASA